MFNIHILSRDVGEHIPKVVYSQLNGDIICEHCCEGNTQVIKNPAIQKIVDIKAIKCINQGCYWTGLPTECELHRNSCQYREIYCEYCKVYKCRINDMNTHISSCDKVLIPCQLKCNSYVERCEMKNHYQYTCNNYKIKCTNKGCSKEIKRIKYNDHLISECQYRSIICPYNKYGCETNNLINKDLNKHLKKFKTEHYLFKINFDNQNILNNLNILTQNINDVKSKLPL